MYERKIIYLHRYEGEVDKGNVGYIKQENYNGTCTFTVMLMNMPAGYKVDTQLVVLPVGHTLCKVHIAEGRGQGLAICEEKQLEKEGVSFREIQKYEIKVSEGVVILGTLAVPKCAREEVRPLEREEVPEIKEQLIMNAGEMLPKDSAVEKQIAPYAREREIYKSKWEQLKSGKKKVNLLGKETEYIEITPGDMIALSNPYHGLVNNAFLLHGYYNYNHLILGPAKGGKSTFFIGVPGNFYKQEINAARMFGFEYFENGGDKVEVGDFGYYMKKVKL